MIYRVMLPNDFFSVGEFVEDGDDDLVQAINAHWQNGRMDVRGYKGLAFPLRFVRPYLTAILSKGFDDQGAFATLRGAR
jgi:hypothetical protein